MDETNALTCREFTHLVTDYLDDCLSSVERRRVAAHLVWCVHCAAYLGQMRRTIWVLRALGGEHRPSLSADRPS